jgi:plastocyanin
MNPFLVMLPVAEFPATSPIAAGGSYTVTSIPAGFYDFKAVASDGTTYWQTNGVTITAGGTYNWTLLPAATGSLRVVNSSTYTVYYLYVVSSSNGCSYGSWGSDQLGANTILPGYSFTLTNISAGTYDFYATTSGGSIYWRRCGTYISGGTTFTWTLN